MFVLLLVLVVILFGFGFLHPVWWVAAASVALVFGAAQYGRRGEGGGWDRSGSSDPGEYHLWDRRRHRVRRRREVRRQREPQVTDTTAGPTGPARPANGNRRAP